MEEQITISRSEYEQLKAAIQRLEEEIALLKGGRNSRSSSTAPSHDIGRSNQISLRTPSVNKSGGQVGHSGHTLSLRETPDEVIDHAAWVCTQCGESLHEVESDFFTRRQVVDLPEVRPLYIEHRSHVKTCPLCGFQNRGIYPDKVKSPIQYGPSVEAGQVISVKYWVSPAEPFILAERPKPIMMKIFQKASSVERAAAGKKTSDHNFKQLLINFICKYKAGSPHRSRCILDKS